MESFDLNVIWVCFPSPSLACLAAFLHDLRQTTSLLITNRFNDNVRKLCREYRVKLLRVHPSKVREDREVWRPNLELLPPQPARRSRLHVIKGGVYWIESGNSKQGRGLYYTTPQLRLSRFYCFSSIVNKRNDHREELGGQQCHLNTARQKIIAGWKLISRT